MRYGISKMRSYIYIVKNNPPRNVGGLLLCVQEGQTLSPTLQRYNLFLNLQNFKAKALNLIYQLVFD